MESFGEDANSSIDRQGRLQISDLVWGPHRVLRPDGSGLVYLTMNHLRQLVLFASDGNLSAIAAAIAHRLPQIGLENLLFYLNYSKIPREVDRRGRVYLPKEMRDEAGLTTSAKVISTPDCIIVENPARARLRWSQIDELLRTQDRIAAPVKSGRRQKK